MLLGSALPQKSAFDPRIVIFHGGFIRLIRICL